MEDKNKQWRFIKQIDVSVLVQLVFLASLIVGTWVNLQNQLLLLRSDINRLLESQKQFQQQIEGLSKASICYEYRLRAIEKRLPDADIGNGSGM
jgi:uncharacterized membrane-anchored protein